jgi:L-ascorbate metabolism protein UlaG (beta-lactamase superfamily)
MKIRWMGHASFLLTSSDGTKVLTDPYEPGGFGGAVGYKGIEEPVDLVTVSHDHADHNYVQGLKGSPKVISGVGAKRERGIRFQGIASFHDQREGKDRGANTIFCWEMDGIMICHLGDLGHALTPSQIAEIGQVDVLLVPVGGFFTIDAAEASALVRQLKPSLVIPMHFKTEVLGFPVAKVEDFTRGQKKVKFLESSETEIAQASLPRETEIWVLKHAK